MTSDLKIKRDVSQKAFLGVLIICALTTVGYRSPEATWADKFSLGSSLRQKGEFDKAITAFKEALQLTQDLNDGQNQIECFKQLGILHWNIGQLKESTSFYNQALSLSQKLAHKDLEAECGAYIRIYEAYSQGKAACDAGLYKESIDQFSAAIGLARKLKSPEHELKCLRQMSLNHFQQENLLNFYLINEQALDIAHRLKHTKEVGRCLNNIGIYHYGKGDYSRALIFYNDAISFIRDITDGEADLSACLNNIGAVYRVLGDYEKALHYIKKALEIDKLINDTIGISIELDNLAVTFRHKGQYNKSDSDIDLSLDYHKKSLEIARKTGNKSSEFWILNNIGLTYFALGKYALALNYFRQALKGAESIGNNHEICNIYDNMGYVFFEIGSYGKSVECFEKALNLARNIGRDDVLWEVYFGLGQCFEKKGNVDSAQTCYRTAIEVIDNMRNRLALDYYRISFTRNKLRVYEALISLLFVQKDRKHMPGFGNEILQIVEKARARSFLEGLEQVATDFVEPSDLRYRKDKESLSRKISITISHLMEAGLDEKQREKLLARLELEEEEYTNLLNRIRTQRMENLHFTIPELISSDKLQAQCLDDRTAILEYFLGEKQSVGIFLDKKHLVLRILPARSEIENSLRAYLKMLSAPPEGEFMGILAAQRIYRELVFPFEDFLSPAIEHLIFVPDGILHYLPFETLIKNGMKNREPRYLIELYDISYAPSVSSLSYLMKKERPKRYPRALLAVGDPVYISRGAKNARIKEKQDDGLREIFLKYGFELSPLPHSRREIRQVARSFPKEMVDILLDSQAREEVLKSKPLDEYQIIHFACHGFLDENTPMRSALVLTLDDDVEEDGFLQVREISDLRMNAELVVLSACQTGKGRLENAEGVLGLPRTFFYAGARSILSSLWKISDKSTSKIMPGFYRYLTAGNNKAKALRLAKLEMLRSHQSHPFYWAAFVLNGDHSWEVSPLDAISLK